MQTFYCSRVVEYILSPTVVPSLLECCQSMVDKVLYRVLAV